MRKLSKELGWSFVAGIVGSGVLASLLHSPNSDALARPGLSTSEPTELADSVLAANKSATASFQQQTEAWRAYMAALRSPLRLNAFVDELIGLEQKVRQGFALLEVGASDEDRARALFRTRIVDDRQLVKEMEAAIEAYQRYLFEQERPIIARAGISYERWAATVNVSKPSTSVWNQALEPIVVQAVREARKDAIKFIATTVAADYAGNHLHGWAREAGFDSSEEGSWTNSLTSFGFDLAASVVIEEATDATDDIVTALSRDLAQAEYRLLEGGDGLFACMRRLKAAHESARNDILTTHQTR